LVSSFLKPERSQDIFYTSINTPCFNNNYISTYVAFYTYNNAYWFNNNYNNVNVNWPDEILEDISSIYKIKTNLCTFGFFIS
jgi:hypothetical protein